MLSFATRSGVAFNGKTERRGSGARNSIRPKYPERHAGSCKIPYEKGAIYDENGPTKNDLCPKSTVHRKRIQMGIEIIHLPLFLLAQR